MKKTVRTTVTLSKELWKEFQKRCIDLEISNTEGLDQAIKGWLENHALADDLLRQKPQPEPLRKQRSS